MENPRDPGNLQRPGQELPPVAPQAPAGPQAPISQTPPGGWHQPIQQTAVAPGQLAGWWSRVGAAILDGLIIWIPSLLILSLLGVGLFSADSDFGVFALVGTIFVMFLVVFVISLIYAPLLMARDGQNNGQTWGKQVTGIRVIRTNGQPFNFAYAALREVVVKSLAVGIASSIIPVIPFLLNYLWPLWDDENRALHDYAVQTRVVRA